MLLSLLLGPRLPTLQAIAFLPVSPLLPTGFLTPHGQNPSIPARRASQEICRPRSFYDACLDFSGDTNALLTSG